jgi:HlyD family secretion protein
MNKSLKMKKVKLIIGLVVFTLVSVLLGYYLISQNQKSDIVFSFEKPELRDITLKTVATGKVKPRQEVNIKPQVSGVIEKIYVKEGDLVKKGQDLAKVKLVPSQVNINNASSSVELAKLRLKDAERELDRQQSQNNSRLDVKEAELRFQKAKADFDRNKSLYEDGVIAESLYESIRIDFELQESAYKNIKTSSTNSLKRFENDVEIRREELQAAINNLQLLKEGASKNSKQVANIIKSTVEGMVLDIPVEVGSSVVERNNFNEGTNVAVIADMTALIFEGKVDESDVGKLKIGMPLVLSVGAIEEETFSANLEFISPKGEEEEGTVKFAIEAAIINNPDVFLRAGYSASADIILAEKSQVLSLMERDVIFEGDSVFVELRTGDQTFEKKEIETGLSDGIYIEVLDGIDSTTEVRNRKLM